MDAKHVNRNIFRYEECLTLNMAQYIVREQFSDFSTHYAPLTRERILSVPHLSPSSMLFLSSTWQACGSMIVRPSPQGGS